MRSACSLFCEHRRDGALTVAPYHRQPFRRLDQFRAADDRGEEAVEHFQVHAVLRHRVRTEEDFEFVVVDVGQRFVEFVGFGHGH